MVEVFEFKFKFVNVGKHFFGVRVPVDTAHIVQVTY